MLRNLGTALHVANPGVFADVANNTLVGDRWDLRATGCGSNTLRVRNVIFVHHNGTGLSVNNCDPLHQYNLYWDNGADLDAPGGFSSGEIAGDPFFTNPFVGNFRPLPGCPAIDAGDPGSRADIGYVEQGQAAVYVDDDYGPGQENDGLTDGLLADYMVYNWPERAPEPLLAGAAALPLQQGNHHKEHKDDLAQVHNAGRETFSSP